MRFPENETILDGRGNCLMPATPIFQKHCFFKKCPKNLTNFGKFKIFFCISCCNFGCTDQNVNQEIGGDAGFLSRLYIVNISSIVHPSASCIISRVFEKNIGILKNVGTYLIVSVQVIVQVAKNDDVAVAT